MAHPHEKALKESSEALQVAMDIINEVMPVEMSALRLGVNQALTLQQSKINGLLGFNAQAGDQKAANTLPPLTSIMGQPIVYAREAVTPSQLQPSDPEKDKFISELNDFYKEFPKLEPVQINGLIQLPGGEVKVRALAQKVGIGDYKSRDIDVTLIDEIKAGIAALNKYDAEMQATLKMLDTGADIVKNSPIPKKK